MKKYLFIQLLISLILFSCSSNHLFDDYYDEWIATNELRAECLLEDEEEPKIFYSKNIANDVNEIRANYYMIVGRGGFNGATYSQDELERSLYNLCKKTRAKIAVYTVEYTDTRTGVTPHTSSYTTYGPYGHSHTTTSTTYSSYSIKRYDYTAYLLCPMAVTSHLRPGILVGNISVEDRTKYKRNTGVLITLVYKDSPAFYANLVYGDIIIKINGRQITDYDDYKSFMETIETGSKLKITFIRTEVEQTVELISN